MTTCPPGFGRGPPLVHSQRPHVVHLPWVSGRGPVALGFLGSSSRRPRLWGGAHGMAQGCRPRGRALCARTAAALTPDPFPGAHKAGDVLGEKYEVQEVLGRGGNAITYKCKEQSGGKEVAVKALSLRSLRGWKQLELFEREGQVLKGLDHPGIPRYLEYFEEESEQDKGFYLVQELASGETLAAMIASGWRADEREVARIAAGVLAILDYLGSRRPPVIHRDVKPENVVIEGGEAGGRVLLVDFGGVQGVAAAGGELGSTIVGTYGYMAPEQFRGSSQPASDLYGLGATLLFLLSGKPPSAFPQERLRLRFDDVAMSSSLRLLVEGLLEPLVEDRMTAKQAVGVLRGDAAPAVPAARRQWEAQHGSGRADIVSGFYASSAVRRRQRHQQLLQQRRQVLLHQQQLRRRWEQQKSLLGGGRYDLMGQYGAELYRDGPYGSAEPGSGAPPQDPDWREEGPVSKPAGSRVVVRQQGAHLEIEIPPAGWTGAALSTAAFALAWNAAVGMWTVASLAGDDLLFGLCSIPFGMAGGQLAWSVAAAAYKGERLEIGLNTWRFQQQLSVPSRSRVADSEDPEAQGGVGVREAGGRTQDLGYVSLKLMTIVNGEPQARLLLHDGDNKQYLLGEGLKYEELRWLWHVINDHLAQNKQLGVGEGDLQRLLPAALQPAAPAVPPRRPCKGAQPLWGGRSDAQQPQHAQQPQQQQRGWAEEWQVWQLQQQEWQWELQRQQSARAAAAIPSYFEQWGVHVYPPQQLEGWEPEQQQQQQSTPYAAFLAEGALRNATGALAGALRGALTAQMDRAAAEAAAVEQWTREVEERAARGDRQAQRRAAMLRWCRDIFK